MGESLMYMCPQCYKWFTIKSAKTFHRNCRSSDGFHSWCKQCVNEYTRQRQKGKREEKKRRKLLDMAATMVKNRMKMDNLPPSWAAERFKELRSMSTIELDEVVNPHKYSELSFNKKKKVLEFVNQYGFRQDFHTESVNTIYAAYCQYAKNNGFSPCHKVLFGTVLISIPWVSKTRRRINGKLTYMYQGIRLKQSA